MTRHRLGRIVPAIVGLLCMLAAAGPRSTVLAQDFRGSITGTVKDATGGVLPGVTVVVTNTETGVAHNAVTDANGFFQVLYLNSGTYTVETELSGFKKVIRSGNVVRVGDVLRVDFALE